LVGIEEGQIHEYIQTRDKLDLDEDGEKTPLLLTTLDLSYWIAIFMTEDLKKALFMITEAHSKRILILEHKAEELELVLINTKSIKVAI
jgi:hypothetical protein